MLHKQLNIIKMKTVNLNPYRIFWAIVLDRKGVARWEFGSTRERAIESAKAKSGDTVYIITDKQFGMMEMSFKGIPNVIHPLRHQLVVKSNSDSICVIPMTEKQFLNPIQY